MILMVHLVIVFIDGGSQRLSSIVVRSDSQKMNRRIAL